MKTKSLFVVYVKQRLDHPSDSQPVYCYAFSHCHAVNLAIKYCVDYLHWALNSFEFSEPIFISNFIK